MLAMNSYSEAYVQACRARMKAQLALQDPAAFGRGEADGSV